MTASFGKHGGPKDRSSSASYDKRQLLTGSAASPVVMHYY